MKKTIRKIFTLLLCAVIFATALCGSASAEGELRWYIKRNGNETPIFPKESEEIKRYGAYYIDDTICNSETEKRIYLTFDAGYENGNVEKVLDALKAESVPAAFFLLDNIILKNTDLVCRMTDEGHFVCNHTKNHKNLCNASEEEIAKDLSTLDTLYKEKTGREMSKYFRFPAGEYSISSLKTVQKLGYKTIFWSFAYEDWDNGKQMSSERAIKKVLSNTHNGAVILLHPTSATNAEILPTLIKEWKAMGYTFGTLDELTENS